MYDPLHYVALYPHGELGWTPCLPLQTQGRSSSANSIAESSRGSTTTTSKGKRKRQLSIAEFYTYRLMRRANQPALLHHGGRLLQEYVVDMAAKIENHRLQHIKNNQDELRADLYQGLQDAVSAGTSSAEALGKRVILPKSFHGSPRHLNEEYHNAMARVRRYGKPSGTHSQVTHKSLTSHSHVTHKSLTSHSLNEC